jgi:hypothetical protein
VNVTASLPNRTRENASVTFELQYPEPDTGDDGSGDSNGGNITASNFAGNTHPAFDIHLEPTANISKFSILTKDDLSETSETRNSHNFFVYTTPEGSLEYEGDSPIQLNGTAYEFDNGPKPVTHSNVQLERFDWDPGITLTRVVDSREEADMVVTFIAEDGSEYPVYIKADASGG